MDLLEIVNDLCEHYPTFLDGNAQCLQDSEKSILIFYKGREFRYDVDLGVIQLLYRGSISSILAPNPNGKDSDDKV